MMQHRVDERARLLGIEIADQLGRALGVGEQRRDCLRSATNYPPARLRESFRRPSSGVSELKRLQRALPNNRRRISCPQDFQNRIWDRGFQAGLRNRRRTVCRLYSQNRNLSSASQLFHRVTVLLCTTVAVWRIDDLAELRSQTVVNLQRLSFQRCMTEIYVGAQDEA